MYYTKEMAGTVTYKSKGTTQTRTYQGTEKTLSHSTPFKYGTVIRVIVILAGLDIGNVLDMRSMRDRGN